MVSHVLVLPNLSCYLSNVSDRRVQERAAKAAAAVASAKAAGSTISTDTMLSLAGDIPVEDLVRAGGLLSLSPSDLLGAR